MGAAELKQLTPGTFEPNAEGTGKHASKGQTTIGDLRKKLSASEALSAIPITVPLQLLAYHIAKLKGCNVDQPRNLAKSVTVE